MGRLLTMENNATSSQNNHEWTSLLEDLGQHIGGLPSQIREDIVNYLGGSEASTPRGGGCTDPFSIFAFLAFALAVMDLMMEMRRKSKKRDVSCSPLPHNVFNELDETVLATYSIVRAALNSLEIDGDCVGK